MSEDARNRESCGDKEETGPLRLCAVSREHRPLEELIRFVLGPDGVIVPDLARRLPGRGVWVGATHVEIVAAERQKVFARSLKRQVSVPAELALLVERLLRQRLVEAVSLANKAGLVVAGFAKVEALMDAGQAVILLHATEAASDGVVKLNRKFKALRGQGDREELIVRELECTELSLAMGRSNVIHAAASEGGASQRIVQNAGRLKHYRTGGRPGSRRA